MESRVDTDKDGLPDLVKVSIIRPRYEGKIPAVMTASPYHQGTNDKASDKALYNMNVDLEVKEPHTIQVEVPDLRLQKLTELVKPKKTVPTTFEFTDIAGIVKGASRGKCVGNMRQFSLKRTSIR